MPRYLKVIYMGAAGLAIVAFLLGLYELAFGGEGEGQLIGDVIVPLAVFAIVLALYKRRKKGIEARQAQSGHSEGQNPHS